MFSIHKDPADLEELINNDDINAIRQTQNIEYLMSTESSKRSLNYFLLSCYQGKYEIVKLFDNLNGYIRESVDIRGNFCFHLCCCMNNEESCKIIDYFVGKYGTDVLNKRNTSGLDVFSFCCVNNLFYVVCHLLEHYRDSINIESRDNTFQKRPITLCLATDSFECYSKLVDFGSALSQSPEFPNNKEMQYKDYYKTHLNSRVNMEKNQTSTKPLNSAKKCVKRKRIPKKSDEEKINYEEKYNKLKEESSQQISDVQNKLKETDRKIKHISHKYKNLEKINSNLENEIQTLSHSLDEKEVQICQLQLFLDEYEKRNRELTKRFEELRKRSQNFESRYKHYKKEYNDMVTKLAQPPQQELPSNSRYSSEMRQRQKQEQNKTSIAVITPEAQRKRFRRRINAPDERNINPQHKTEIRTRTTRGYQKSIRQ